MCFKFGEFIWFNILIQFAANIASGIIIAIMSFLLSYYIFKIPNLSGSRNATVTTQKSSYNPHKNMILTYKILLWLEGKYIYWSVKKNHKKFLIKRRTIHLTNNYFRINKNYKKLYNVPHNPIAEIIGKEFVKI